MKKKRHLFRNFIVLVLLGLLGYLGYYIYNESDVFIIKNVEIMGNIMISESDIEKFIVDDNLHYFKSNQYDLKERLETYPKIKDCAITKVFPDGLNIIITERLPIVAIHYSEQYLLVDEDLYVVEVANDPRSFYVINEYSFDDFNIGYQMKDDHRYILKNAIDLALLVMYSELENTEMEIVDKKIEVSLSDTLKAKFGDGDNIESRFSNMIEVYFEITKNNNPSGVIDVSHDGLPVFQPFEE